VSPQGGPTQQLFRYAIAITITFVLCLGLLAFGVVATLGGG
jgi:hypothetical protein